MTGIDSVLGGQSLWHVEHGDSLEVLRSMPDASVDMVVTDPPAGISFMGKEFDHHRGGRENWIRWLASILAEAHRVTKPGGRILCWSIPRTMHWTGMAVEDAGWEIENVVSHLFGTGFPKGKTQLKPAWEGWWLARKPSKKAPTLNIDDCRINPKSLVPGGGVNFAAWRKGEGRTDLPLSNGIAQPPHSLGRWPTNLVLSHSPECQLKGTKKVKATSIHGEAIAVRRSGVHTEAGGHQTIGREQPVKGYADSEGKETVEDWICVDGCPIAELDSQSGILHHRGNRNPSTQGGGDVYGIPAKTSLHHEREELRDSGGASRFFNTFEPDPSETNGCVEGCPIAELDSQSGILHHRGNRNPSTSGGLFWGFEPTPNLDHEREELRDSGGASRYFNTFEPDEARFFYTAKASKSDRNDGVRNNHPTVKSTALMRHFVKLIKPIGIDLPIVLDPFCGSGSTGRGAVLEGCRFIGIERENSEKDPYVTIARARIEAALSSTEKGVKGKPQEDTLIDIFSLFED